MLGRIDGNVIVLDDSQIMGVKNHILLSMQAKPRYIENKSPSGSLYMNTVYLKSTFTL